MSDTTHPGPVVSKLCSCPVHDPAVTSLQSRIKTMSIRHNLEVDLAPVCGNSCS